MVTQKDKYPCPVCGEMISKQGVAGHNKSKKHLAVLEKQQQEQQPPPQEEPKTQKLDIKPVPSIKSKTEIKDEQDMQTKDEEWRGFFAD